MKFRMIADEVKDDNRAMLEKEIDWINSEEKDDGLRHYSTDRRWEQYQNGEITREQAKEFAIKRATKMADKDLNERLEKLERVENTPMPEHIDIDVEWSKNYWNATATVYAGRETASGHAGGCGYDKRSSAVGSALNACYGVLNALYSYKESQLEDGKTDGTIGSRENRKLICYGSGYSAMPYFEGAVGSECHWKMFDLMGYDVHGFERAKYSDYYSIDRRH